MTKDKTTKVTKPKELLVMVCPFHRNIPMVKAFGKDKNGKETKSVYCPKCFCSTPKIVKIFDTKQGKLKTSA